MKNVLNFNDFLLLEGKKLFKKEQKEFKDELVKYLKSLDADVKEQGPYGNDYIVKVKGGLSLSVSVRDEEDGELFSITSCFSDAKKAIKIFDDVVINRMNNTSGKYNFRGTDQKEVLNDFKEAVDKLVK